MTVQPAHCPLKPDGQPMFGPKHKPPDREPQPARGVHTAGALHSLSSR